MPGLNPYVRILAANQRTVLSTPGTTIFLRKADGEIRVTLRQTKPGEDAQAYTLRMNEAEEWLHAVEFSSVEIENTSGIQNEIELYIGYGRFVKPVPDIINVEVSNTNPLEVEVTAAEPSPAASGTVDSVDDQAVGQGNANAVEVLAANQDRVRAIITNPAGNTDTLRVGDSGVDVDNGIPLAPGESVPWDSRAACYVCSEGATASQVVCVTAFNL